MCFLSLRGLSVSVGVGGFVLAEVICLVLSSFVTSEVSNGSGSVGRVEHLTRARGFTAWHRLASASARLIACFAETARTTRRLNSKRAGPPAAS